MTLAADRVYTKSRVDLDQFERAAFAALRSFVPNFFKDGRDDTIWGQHLRGIAAQIARINYQTHYQIYGADPAYLNPADLLRRYGGPLHLNRNYPGTTQLDADFKVMVLALLDAYRLGSTAKSSRMPRRSCPASRPNLNAMHFIAVGPWRMRSCR